MDDPTYRLLSYEDRRRLAQKHRRSDMMLVQSWDDDLQRVVLKDVARPEPICAACKEPWGRDGCSVVRALAVLAVYEVKLREGERRVSELTEALTPRFGVARLRDPGNKIVQLRMEIDGYSLIHGGMPVVESTLFRMAAEFRVWFERIGDLERLHADHVYALALDSQYYEFLTKEFKPSASIEKRPGAPWETTPWDTPRRKTNNPASGSADGAVTSNKVNE